jgi:isopropylmalate/homocitrate/citramalate synthase
MGVDVSETTVVSVKTAKADARRRLRELEAGRDATIAAAVTALARQAAHAAKAAELRADTARAVKAVSDLLGAPAAAQVLDVPTAEIKQLVRESGT